MEVGGDVSLFHVGEGVDEANQLKFVSDSEDGFTVPQKEKSFLIQVLVAHLEHLCF